VYVKRKGIEVEQGFSLGTALNIHEEGFIIPKTISDCKKWEKKLLSNDLCHSFHQYPVSLQRTEKSTM